MTRILVTVLLAALLPLAGCSDDDPVATPTPSPSPSSASPTPSESPKPESAEDFIERWVGVHTEMQNTGETKPFMAMSRGCDACAQLASTVRGFYSNGGYVKTDGWHIQSIRKEGQRGNRTVYKVTVKSAPTDYLPSAGDSVQHLDGGTVTQRIELTVHDGNWNVADLSQYAS